MIQDLLSHASSKTTETDTHVAQRTRVASSLDDLGLGNNKQHNLTYLGSHYATEWRTMGGLPLLAVPLSSDKPNVGCNLEKKKKNKHQVVFKNKQNIKNDIQIFVVQHFNNIYFFYCWNGF